MISITVIILVLVPVVLSLISITTQKRTFYSNRNNKGQFIKEDRVTYTSYRKQLGLSY